MKYLLLLLAVASLPACGQTSGIAAPKALQIETPPLSSGQRPCDPALNTYPEDEWTDSTADKDGYADPNKIVVYRCDKVSRKWTFDPAMTKKEISDTAKSVADGKEKARRRQMLSTAVISRVLTEKEMAEVVALGTGLFNEPFSICGGASSCSFSGDYRTMADAHELYLSRKFNDALIQQFKLRAIAAEHRQTWQEACAKARADDPGIIGCGPTLLGAKPEEHQMGVEPGESIALDGPGTGASTITPSVAPPGACDGIAMNSSGTCREIPLPMPITGCPSGMHPVQTGTDQFECRTGSGTTP